MPTDETTNALQKFTIELAQVRVRMKDLSRRLRAVFPGATVIDRIDFSKYENSFFPENGPRYVIEFYVDVALDSGKSMCWWVDVERIGQIWQIDGSLRRDEGAGEDSLWKASYKATTVDELFSNLSSLLSEIERFVDQKGEHFL